MEQFLKPDEWAIIEEGFSPLRQKISESLFSLGNGHMGQRGNFEEDYSGPSLQGSYFAGIYYPDKTRVGWWKNGYPEYFAKVLNSVNWIGIRVAVDDEALDLAKCEVGEFRRVLDMKTGRLTRAFTARLKNGREIRVVSERFLSMARPEIGAIRYAITPLNFSSLVDLTPYLDGDVTNRDADHGEKFWVEAGKNRRSGGVSLTVKTKKLGFYVCSAMAYTLEIAGKPLIATPEPSEKDKFVAESIRVAVKQGQTLAMSKYAANVTSRDYPVAELETRGYAALAAASKLGFAALAREQADAWEQKWRDSDIVIAGDIAAQQGIRFNIFQLNQTYTGKDERLNIGPKGFTGEKYGGGTYWDTEAYCLPFYLSTAKETVARNLLLYRYRHLEKAQANARKLGFKTGALFPMVTMDGEECHNEWEITFEEIHRNGAIAYAIYNYVNYTGDNAYLAESGFEVLAEISRFWAERVNFSKAKGKYVILGVTGPNEYENNVNNNWYTNRIASWTLEYTLEAKTRLQGFAPTRYAEIAAKLALDETEFARWQDIIAHMYYPVSAELKIFLQQDGFLDKAIIPAAELGPTELPLYQRWSWDRILRSCYIKQADVLQGLFLLGDRYDLETKRNNFHFYEPLTVHESSLSPSVHSVLACELGEWEKAYELYLRSSRLDLDNYNNDTEDGCHITSMAGSWLAVVYGFGGLRAKNGRLHLQPQFPQHWDSYTFKVLFRGASIRIHVARGAVTVKNESDTAAPLTIYGIENDLAAGGDWSLSMPATHPA